MIPKVSNWVMVEFLRLLNTNNLDIKESKLTPSHLIEMLKMMDEGQSAVKLLRLFEEMFDSGKRAARIVEEKGLLQISDEDELAAIIDELIAAHQKLLRITVKARKKH